jgi:hypothetical protein
MKRERRGEQKEQLESPLREYLPSSQKGTTSAVSTMLSSTGLEEVMPP